MSLQFLVHADIRVYDANAMRSGGFWNSKRREEVERQEKTNQSMKNLDVDILEQLWCDPVMNNSLKKQSSYTELCCETEAIQQRMQDEMSDVKLPDGETMRFDNREVCVRCYDKGNIEDERSLVKARHIR